MSPIDYIARAEENMRREYENSSQKTGVDRAVDRYVKVAKTQGAIIAEIKQMAATLAAAAIASHKALGDPANYAIDKWTRILSDEAKRIIRNNTETPHPKIESGTVIDQKPSAEPDNGEDVLGEKS